MPSRERSFRLEAVVLRHSNWGEADRLLWLFSLEMGKVRALAKGVRKVRSRKSGHLEPITHVHLQLARGRDLLIVTQAETIHPYLPLHDDILLTTWASYVIELLDRFTFEEGENRTLFRLLVDTLARLSQGDPPELVVRYYEVRLLDLVGFRPQLFNCVNCGREIQAQDQFFSANLGGVVCPDCAAGIPGTRPVSMGALKYLRHFQRSSFAEASWANITPALNREMEGLMQHYLTYQLERGLNTPPFLRRLRKPSDSETPPNEEEA